MRGYCVVRVAGRVSAIQPWADDSTKTHTRKMDPRKTGNKRIRTTNVAEDPVRSGGEEGIMEQPLDVVIGEGLWRLSLPCQVSAIVVRSVGGVASEAVTAVNMGKMGRCGEQL